MPPPKLHLNEHLSPRLAEQLGKYGFDVTSTLELGMVEADDDEQLAYAAAKQSLAIRTLPAHEFFFPLDGGRSRWGSHRGGENR